MGIDHNKRLKEHLLLQCKNQPGYLKSDQVAGSCCHYRMYRRSCQYTVFFYVEGSDQLSEGS